MVRSVLAAVLLALIPAAPAAADVRVLAEREDLGAPVLDGGRVVYGDGSRRALTVFEQPAAGGEAVELARVAVPLPSWELDRSAAGLALRMGPLRDVRRLLAGPPQGPLGLVQRRAREGPAVAEERGVFAVPGGPLVLERTDRFGMRLRAVLRPPGGPARVLATPAGADLHHLAVAGAVAAVVVPRRGEIVLLDLPSGAVRQRLPMVDLAGTELLGLALSETGDVALTVQDGLGTYYLGWMPAGAAEPRVVIAGDGFGHVGTAAGRIAMTQSAMRGDAVRVRGARPVGRRAANPVPRPAHRVRPRARLRRAARGVGDRRLPARRRRRLAAGRGRASRTVRANRGRVHARDHLARAGTCALHRDAGRRCRIDLRVYGTKQQRLARRVVGIPRGREQTVRIPVRPGINLVFGRVIDPDGRAARGRTLSPAMPELYVQRDQPQGVPPLSLTGERTLPDVPEENYWFRRHLVVYEWIAARAHGRRVVDLACGEGYGSAVLARTAASVVGVDANPDAFEHARLKYTSERVRFERNMIELWTGDVDCVVFLQTIEHVQDPDAVLDHIRGLIGPRGVAYVSTPNVLTLAPKGAARSGNPWHVREYRAREYRALCERHFGSVDLLGLFHARKLRVHQWAIEHAGWDAVHARLGITRPFYDRFTPAISTRDFALRRRGLDRALDFLAVLRP